MNGACILAKALVDQGVEYAFGIVGIPIVEVSLALQAYGIRFIAMRNEQSACYAAQAMSFISGKPAICLVVSGPGLLHALGGLANATVNCWPVIVIGGSCDLDQVETGAFQECLQLDAARPFCKMVAQVTSLEKIPFFINKAVKMCTYGRPGAVYIDLPGNFVLQETSVELQFYSKCLPAPKTRPTIDEVEKAVNLLKNSKKPLLIFGKGCVSKDAVEFSEIATGFVNKTNLPFLPAPMAKGILPDDHEFSAAAARSLVLREADVILLVGARLNWILHFGLPPRFKDDVKIVQIDSFAEEFHQNVPAACSLLGDAKESLKMLSSVLEKWHFDKKSDWINEIANNTKKNRDIVENMTHSTSPLNYYSAYKAIRDLLPKDCFIINEGANTMDIGRTMLPNFKPKRRLDAGTFGTMGVGLGFAISASLYCRQYEPATKVFCIQGDSAFGFSGMEIETAIRYQLPIIFIVFNNNGIYSGMDDKCWQDLTGEPGLSIPPTCLTPNLRYDKMMQAFGGEGFFCKTQEEISSALLACLNDTTNKPSLINILIDPTAQRKEQKFDWLTRKKLAKL